MPHADPVERKRYHQQYGKRKKKSIKKRFRRWYYEKTYGVTLEWYNETSKKQNGRCIICNGKPKASHGRLSVDHCHTSGTVRGLVCGRCNLAIGLIDDNWETASKMAKYLKKWH